MIFSVLTGRWFLVGSSWEWLWCPHRRHCLWYRSRWLDIVGFWELCGPPCSQTYRKAAGKQTAANLAIVESAWALLPPSSTFSSPEESQAAGERNLFLFFYPFLIRKTAREEAPGCERERRGGVKLRSDWQREQKTSGQWLVFPGCVYECVFDFLSILCGVLFSLSLWCSCQSIDCRSVSASAAPHTLRLRPECSKADTELLTIAWTNT